MKVLHVIPSLATSYGGPSLALINIKKALEMEGIKVSIVTTIDKGELAQEFSGSIHLFKKKFLKSYFYSSDLRDWVRKNLSKYDLIHIHSLFSYPSTIAAYYARKYKVPFIIRPFGTLDRESMRHHSLRKILHFAFFDRENLNQASLIHCTSHSEQEEFQRFHLKVKSQVIPLGIIPEEYSTSRKDLESCYGIPEGKKVILFLSRIHPRKGLNLLMEALQILRGVRDDFIVLIAGSSQNHYMDKLKRMAKQKSLDKFIIWLGEVSGKKKMEVLHGSDLFVLPSYRESFGLVVIEAMASGLPVVISDRVAIHEVIKNAMAGRVVFLSPIEIKEAINELLDDHELRKKMGENGRRLVLDKFDIRRSAKTLASIYSSLIYGS